MNGSFKIPLLLCLLGVSVSCSSRSTKKIDRPIVLPATGMIHENITGFTDKDISYALYIPGPSPATAVQDKDKTGAPPVKSLLPVMVLFDPHGSGLLPVRKYRELADRYQIILVGSNNAKNGLSIPEINGILSSVMKEITVYPIDTARIYVSGFSGGSRVAAIAAGTYPCIKGVIGCGAGLPGGAPSVGRKFDYFGIAGTADFNMFEMLRLDEEMTRAGIRHFITTFPGPHAWPPCEVMEEGFGWITLNAMRDGNLGKNNDMITGIMAGFDTRIKGYIHQNHLLAAANACREAIQFASGLVPAGKFEKQLESIKQEPFYAKQVGYRETIMKKEMEEQDVLEKSLLSKDLGWWKTRVALMDSRNMKGKNPEDTLMNARLKAFLSLYCYSLASAVMLHHEYSDAEKTIAVYEVADPPNPEPNYMRAIILAGRSEDDRAMKQLQVALVKGFTDKQRMNDQPEFQPLKSSPAWFDLLKTMK